MTVFDKFSNLRIRYKLIFSYCLCFILIFLIGSSLIFIQVRSTIRENLEAELDNKTSAIVRLVKASAALSIETHLKAVSEKNLEIVERLHQKWINGKVSKIEAQRVAMDIMLHQTVGKTGYLYVIDSKGLVRVHPKKGVTGNSYMGFDFIRTMVAEKKGFMEYQWQNPSETRPHPKSQYFSYFKAWDWIIAATSYKTEFLNLINMEDLWESINATNMGKRGYSAILNTKGEWIVHPRIQGGHFELKNKEMADFIQEIIIKKSGKFEYTWQNPDEDRLYNKIATVNHIPDYGWIVLSTVYEDDFFRPLVKISTMFVIIILVCIIFTVLISVKLAKGITRPIEMLTDQLKHYTEDRYPERIIITGEDEIGQLSEDFNSFMDHLKRERTNRRIAEQALKKSEGKFKVLFNSSYNFIGLLKLDGTVVEINRTALDLIEVSLADVVGLPFWETPWWSASSRSKSIIKTHIDQCVYRGFIRSEFRHSDASGNIMVIDFSLKTILDDTGAPVAIVADGRDITDRKNMETALREGEARYRAILAASPNPIILYDRVGKVIFVNQAFTRIFGWEEDEIVGAKIDFVPRENLKETVKTLEFVMESMQHCSFETRRYTKAGNTVDVSISAAAVPGKDKSYAGMVVNFTDITHIKETDKELRKARNSIKNIIDLMPFVLVGINMDGIITQWNLAAEEMTGTASDTALGKFVTDMFPQLESQMLTIKSAIRNHTIETEPKAVLPGTSNGSFFDVTVYPIMSKEEDGAVILVQDISNRVLIEEMMIQSEKMLSVGGLAAGMAHEINNPLAGMIQNTQVLMKRLKEPLPINLATAKKCGLELEDIKRYMEKRDIFTLGESVLTAGARAAKIVENMLSFSRKGDHSIQKHDLAELLDATVEIAENDYGLKEKYDFRSITIKRDYSGGVQAVPCEKSKIQQVFLNLLQNGAQAMAKAGLGSSACFIFRVMEDRDWVRVEIEDNGPGMDQETSKRSFEPFFTTKDEWTGTGLGLSVSYFIITKNHGGTIKVESHPGQGTKFIIKLPIKAGLTSIQDQDRQPPVSDGS